LLTSTAPTMTDRVITPTTTRTAVLECGLLTP